MTTEKKSNIEPSVIATDKINLSNLESARVHLSGSDRLRIEFNIQDLVKRLTPGSAVAHCGGCNGCMGCAN